MGNEVSDHKVHYTLKELPEELRPRERLMRDGAGSLSDTELLAIILRTGTASETALELAQRILATFGGLHKMHNAGIEELCHIKGVGVAKAVQIKAAIELGRRAFSTGRYERTVVRTPTDAAQLLMSEMRYLERETLRVILLDSKHHVLGAPTVSVGTVNSSLAHPRECFKEAIRHSAVAVIFVHNHPSGDPQPSDADLELTKQLKEAGSLLGIEVLDHIIIGDGIFVSLKERGMV